MWTKNTVSVWTKTLFFANNLQEEKEEKQEEKQEEEITDDHL
jgi:F0F1-type ATP synthase epsilon subunit